MIGIAALLVDLDGTLVDTREANFRAYAQALAEVGIVIDRPRFDAIADGRNWRQFLPAFIDRTAGIDAAHVAARKVALYPGMLALTTLNDGLVALIRALHGPCKTALVTTASAVNARAVLAHHRLDNLFDTIVTGNDVARHKPDPQAYHLAAERLGVVASDCLVFEDSGIGIAAATAFGAPVLRVATG